MTGRPLVTVVRRVALVTVVRRIALVGLCLGLSAAAAAQQVEVRAYLERAEVAVDRQFTLHVEVAGAGRADEEPRLPDLSDFAVYLGVGTRTSMQFVNGRSSTSFTYQYRFRATTAGTHAIGPVRMRVDGEEHATDPLTIRVTPAGSASARRAPDRSRSGVEIGPEDLFVEASVSTREPWVNEPVLVEYRLFTRVDVESYGIVRAPGASGFWVEEIAAPRAPRMEQVVRGGVQYTTTAVRRAALFPTGPGPRTIEPLALEARVRVRSERRFGDPFGFDPFGGGLFGRSVPVTVASDAIEMQVRPLPAAGRPEAFTGLVGNLDVTTSLDATEAVTNEALTFRLDVRGAGNLRTLPAPEVAFPPHFDVYPPEVSDDLDAGGVSGVSGIRRYAYVLVPRAPGSHTIPAVELGYFDAAGGRYAVAASDPLTVEVTGDAGGGGPVLIGGGRTRPGTARQDIRFIRVATSAFVPIDRQLFRSAVFWTVLVVPALGVAGALVLRRHRRRLEGNVAYARRRRASKLARSRLAQARGLRAPEQHQAFVAGISQALLGFLGDSLNVAEAGLVQDDIRRELAARGVAGEVVEQYLKCLDRCDQQRFAPPSAGDDNDGETAALLEEAEQAMTVLGEALRS